MGSICRTGKIMMRETNLYVGAYIYALNFSEPETLGKEKPASTSGTEQGEPPYVGAYQFFQPETLS